ncbi:MAG: flagellin [Nautiliaceae bacterium]|jgi:flagellin
MKINNNMANYINNNLNKVNENIEKIANPAKTENIVNAFVEDVFNSEIDTSMQEINNFNEAIGFMQIADGALNNISDNLNNIKTLQTAANNAALNSDNLSAINEQIQKYAQNINDTLNQTTYNDKSVFGQFNFNGTEVNTSMPSFSIENMEDFEKALNSARSSIGAFQNEAVSKVDNLSTYVINLSKVKSQNEVDVAKAVTDMKNSEIMLNAAVLAQVHKMNLSQESLMNLLKG